MVLLWRRAFLDWLIFSLSLGIHLPDILPFCNFCKFYNPIDSTTFLPFGPGASDAALPPLYYIQAVTLDLQDPPPAFGAQQYFEPIRLQTATVSQTN